MKRIFLSLFIPLIISLSVSAADSLEKQKKIFLDIHYENAKALDTLAITVGDPVSILVDQGKLVHKRGMNANGSFTFLIPVDQLRGIFVISRKVESADLMNWRELIKPQFWEVGDSIHITIRDHPKRPWADPEFQFTGKGALKYTLSYELTHFRTEEYMQSLNSDKWPAGWDGNILKYDGFGTLSLAKQIKLSYLSKYRNRLTNISYNILKGNVMASGRGMFHLIESFSQSGQMKMLDTLSKLKIVNLFNQAVKTSLSDLDTSVLSYSVDYMSFLWSGLNAGSYLNTNSYSPEWIYSAIKQYEIGQHTKELLILLLFYKGKYYSKLDALYTDALAFTKDSVHLRFLKDLDDFEARKFFLDYPLEDVKGQQIKISSFKKKAVLVDFWFTGCGGCASYYKNTLAVLEKKFLGNPGVLFISISIDRAKSGWLQSIYNPDEFLQYTSPNVLNLYTGGLRHTHPMITRNRISSYPFVVLLNNGNVKYMNTPELYDLNALDKIISDLVK